MGTAENQREVMQEYEQVQPAIAAHLPDGTEQALAMWQQVNRRFVRFSSLLTNGMTDAAVLTVVVNDENSHDKKLILKLIPNSGDWREPVVLNEAQTNSPKEFADEHLVTQPYPPIVLGLGWIAMFQEIAGGSLQKLKPLSTLSRVNDIVEPIAHIAQSVIADWNPASISKDMTIKAFFKYHLSSKALDGGTLARWIDTEFGPNYLRCGAILFNDNPDSEVYFNPVAVARSQIDLPQTTISATCGLAHGDLHLENVLIAIESNPDGRNYRLIDLSKFDRVSPLSRDPINLLFSVISHHLTDLDLTTRQRLLKSIVSDSRLNIPTSLSGLIAVVDAVLIAGSTQASQNGFTDEWASQQLLSLSAQSLVWASRERFSFEERVWWLELSASALTKWATSVGAHLPDRFEIVGKTLSERTRVAAAAVSSLEIASSHFDGRMTCIAIASTDLRTESTACLGYNGWDAVIEFDPLTDHDNGAFALMREHGAPVKLVAANGEQPKSFGKSITTWIAAAGLSVEEGVSNEVPMKNWRSQFLSGISQTIRSLASAHASPILVVILGEVSPKVRQIAEQSIDAGGERVRIICVGTSGAGDLRDYDAEYINADPNLVAAQIKRRKLSESNDNTWATIPGGRDGDPVKLSQENVLWLDEIGEILHSRVGLSSDSIENVGAGYYRGRKISWFELETEIDVYRPEQVNALQFKVTELLQQGGTLRWTYTHTAGAGGTSVVRRVAWQLHLLYPVLVVSRIRDPKLVVTRIRELARITSRELLVVIEDSLETTIDVVYNQLRTDSIPVLLLIVNRGRVSGSNDSVDISRRLGSMTGEEAQNFVTLFAAEAPDRASELAAISSQNRSPRLPFFYALTAFQSEYRGLHEFVAKSLSDLNSDTLAVVTTIALVHRFAGVAIPSDVFAIQLGIPRGEPVLLSEILTEQVLGVILEEPVGFWRTTHSLIADEILKQSLTPAEQRVRGSDAWRTGLANQSRRLIQTIDRSYPESVPADVRTVLERLFLYRNSRDETGLERASFSDLIQKIPASNARVDVLHELAETFQDEPHYWAHYGRLLAIEKKNHPAAREAFEKALAIDPGDSAIWHMQGVSIRLEIRDMLGSRLLNQLQGTAYDSRVANITREALSKFKRAADLNDASEYPYVEIVRLCVDVLLAAKDHSTEESFAKFFGNAQNSLYGDLLDYAEDALDHLSEIAGDDKVSDRTAAVRADILEVYDDHAALIDEWRLILTRDDVVKSPIRRRMIRIIRQRANGWRLASRAELTEAVSLLDENLQDNPADGKSVREWLMAARFTEARLDRALEYVSYWVANEPTRDALFYDYVLSALATMNGTQSARKEFLTKLNRLKERSKYFPQRRTSFEWLGHGSEIGALVNNGDLLNWKRKADEKDPALLRRVDAMVASIDGPTSGRLILGGDIEAFFTPSVVEMVHGRDENTRVSALIGFSYDGLRAWSVKRIRE